MSDGDPGSSEKLSQNFGERCGRCRRGIRQSSNSSRVRSRKRGRFVYLEMPAPQKKTRRSSSSARVTGLGNSTAELRSFSTRLLLGHARHLSRCGGEGSRSWASKRPISCSCEPIMHGRSRTVRGRGRCRRRPPGGVAPSATPTSASYCQWHLPSPQGAPGTADPSPTVWLRLAVRAIRPPVPRSPEHVPAPNCFVR